MRVLDPTACGAAVEALFALHATRFGERGVSSTFAGPRLRDFHATLARTLAERGDLALTFLRVKGRDVAVHYGFRQGGRLWHFQGGFDPSTDVASPGATLLMIVLEEDVFRAGLSEYDFLDGAEAYKGAFATGVRRLFDVDLYRPSRVGRAAALAKGALGAAKSALKAGLLRGRRKG